MICILQKLSRNHHPSSVQAAFDRLLNRFVAERTVSNSILGTLDRNAPLQWTLDNIVQTLSLSTVPVLYMTSRTDNRTVVAFELDR